MIEGEQTTVYRAEVSTDVRDRDCRSHMWNDTVSSSRSLDEGDALEVGPPSSLSSPSEWYNWPRANDGSGEHIALFLIRELEGSA